MIEARIFEEYPTTDFTVGNITMNFNSEIFNTILDDYENEYEQFTKLLELALTQNKTIILTGISDNCINDNSNNEKAKNEG